MNNHLANENSPYLLQHAENPVDWYPWGGAAFDKARREDKPLFLSIGYSTCHWCHVMARECFEDEEVAALLNKDFVSVKVDREERPDVDSVYMTACELMTGGGGWPLSVFMTADGKPFFAGTYFPKRPRFGMPGFIDLLNAVSDQWRENRAALLASAESVTKAMGPAPGTGKADTVDLIGKAVGQFRRRFDEKYGGFGTAPKFPSPHDLLFLLREYEKHGDKSLLHMVGLTLHSMYSGGIFDHIGFGFSRYSTDRYFLVPHFEKMLYDNALLILAYAKCFELTRDGFYLNVAEKTAEYVLRELVLSCGGFVSAQDADSDGEEGRYYVFTPDELTQLLGEKEGRAFAECFDITEEGNFEGASIPNLLKSGGDPEAFAPILGRLREYRRLRARLNTDDKILTFWNSLMIAALCALYRVSRNESWLRAALNAQRFIESAAIKNGILYASFRNGRLGAPGFLSDYAGYALALIALYDAALDPFFLEKAKEITEKAIDEFFDKENGGFFLSGKSAESLPVRTKETRDGALPSGNSLMAYLLSRLAVLSPTEKIESTLERQLAFMKKEATALPFGYAAFLTALSDLEEPPVKVEAKGPAEALCELPFIVPLGGNMIVSLGGEPEFRICKGHSCLPSASKITKEMLR
ncbi:MAG: thioredoxin domain-containing protein [Clostridia bacterium]|nr:thioredoxin domain-containing protein [Clostridia bacterium]